MNYMKLKNKLDKARNDINEKTKYSDELKEIQEKFDYQNVKVMELESELNEKNKNINTLKNNIKDLEKKNIEIMIRSNANYEIINKKHNQEIQKLVKELKENEEYFNDYEKNRIKKQEEINELNRLNKELNKEKQIIEKELNVKKILINEYKKE